MPRRNLIEIFPAVGSHGLAHHYRVKAANGEIVATSEAYTAETSKTSKANCKKGARALKRVAAAAEIVEVEA